MPEAADTVTPLRRINRSGSSRERSPSSVLDEFDLTPLERNEALLGCLNTRDLRKIDETFLTSLEPSLLVRKHAILYNGLQVRAIILHDKMFLLASAEIDEIEDILPLIIERLGQGSKMEQQYDPNGSFELRALEAMLMQTVGGLEQMLKQHQDACQQCSEKLQRDISSALLETLRATRNDAEAFELMVEGIRAALAEVLGSDEDMRHMYLSEIFMNPSIFGDKAHFGDHEEVEILLESYLEGVEGVLKFAKICSKQIENTQETVELRLGFTRNVVMKIEVIVSAVTMAFAFGALISGIFGMNLRSGVEGYYYWFWTTTSAIIVLAVAMLLFSFTYLNRHGILNIT